MTHRVLFHWDDGTVSSFPVRAVASKHGLTTFTLAQSISPGATLEKVELVLDLGDGVRLRPIRLGIKPTAYKKDDCVTLENVSFHCG